MRPADEDKIWFARVYSAELCEAYRLRFYLTRMRRCLVQLAAPKLYEPRRLWLQAAVRRDCVLCMQLKARMFGAAVTKQQNAAASNIYGENDLLEHELCAEMAGLVASGRGF
jgi:hypothetical protein